MERDALTAGVEPGGLTSRIEIKVLICYILKTMGQPVPSNFITDGISSEGLANYFELVEAVSSLESSGHIAVSSTDNGIPSYVVTPIGEDAVKTLEMDVPYTVKRSACNCVMKMLARARHEKENDVTVVREENGVRVTCRVLDMERELMSVSVLLPNMACAETVKESFLNDPTETFLKVTEALLGHEL